MKNQHMKKNNLYRKIVQTNREKEISKFNRINNKGNKKFSIIKKNIFNIIKDTNNKKKRFKNPVLSLKANQLITSFNAEFKNGTLKIEVPKKEKQSKLPETKKINIK